MDANESNLAFADGPPAQPEGAAATVDALAWQFASLPLPSLAPALVLLLGGLLLLVAGRHFLRPVLVVTAIVAGAVLGGPLLGVLAPGLGRIGLTLAGGLLGLVAVAATWRLMYGSAAGVVAGFLAGFLALLAVDAGLVDARIAAGRGQQDSAIATELAPRDDEADRSRRDALLDRTPAAMQPLVDWADARWRQEPPQVRTFVAAAAAGGAFIGLVVGAWLPQNCAVILTSLVGAIFTLVGAAPLLARATERLWMPERPFGWILLWAALALAGWLLQTWRGDPDAVHGGGEDRSGEDRSGEDASSGPPARSG